MLRALQDVEYMTPYPPGYVTNHIKSILVDIPVGLSVTLEPDDYAGIPLFHFYNTLRSVLTREYGGSNIQMRLDKEQGVIEAMRIR